MALNSNQDPAQPYLKMRKDFFNRQQLFLEDHAQIQVSIRPQHKHRKATTKKSSQGNSSQAISAICGTEMNTIRAEYIDISIMHSEGGWPKDVNTSEPEIVNRYRKKLEKEDGYQSAVPLMTEEMEEHIKYNNTINFYRDSYNCIPVVGDRDLVPSATVVNVYRNPASRARAVSRITFAPDNAGRMAIAQSPQEFDPALREHLGEAFFWEVENPSRPEGTVRGPSHITDVRYHPKDLHSLIGSLFTGQVATWDARVSPNPQGISTYEVSHTDVCTSALWINSKSGCELFSCGLDGQVIWWDVRNLSERLDSVWCDPEKGQCREENAIGATVLEYEHTLPTKFLCGNEKGNIMVFMKKGKSPNDRMIHLYKAHKGPVRALHRNPMFIKNFLSVGDYHLRVFAEDCRESSIMWTIPSKALYSDANWLNTRPSGFVACRVDGVLEFWDLLIQGASNILTLQVCEDALTAVCAADGGKHVAVGTKSGDIRFVKMTDFMGEFEKNDKPLLATVFDRESRREKYLEQRNREIRLKKRDQDKKEAENQRVKDEREAEMLARGVKDPNTLSASEARSVSIRHEAINDPLVIAERDFFLSISAEIKSKGIEAFPDKVVDKEAVGKNGKCVRKESNASITITASDLAAFNSDDDEEPQQTVPKKTEKILYSMEMETEESHFLPEKEHPKMSNNL